jgi:hypothetical protein
VARPEDKGEHPNGRKAMDDVIKRCVDHGMSLDEAKERARKSALRIDRRNG